MKKRFTACMIGATLLTAALTGCSGGKSADAPASSADQTTTAEAASTDAASVGKVAIELFHQKPENVELYNTLVNKFMEENPDIQVNVTLAESTTTTLISRVAAGNIPQLVSVFPWSASYKDMFREGLFMDLTDQDFMKRVTPSVLERCEVNGKQYSLPLTTNSFGLYYNVDIFNELGLTIPKTMDEMWGVCDKLVEAGIQPFSFPDKKAVRINQQFDRMLIGCVDHDFYSKCDEQINGSYNIKDDPNIRKYAETILKRVNMQILILLDMMTNLLTKNLPVENLLCTLMVPGQ